jgi:ATP-dependent DNA helicase RecQ
MADDLELALKTHFGFPSFRPNQRVIVEATLAGRDVFAALPTGGGKSLCYQLPALVRPGLTVVVSPLIALMKDQVDAAREDGIAAAVLNSALSQDEARATWRDLAAGRVKLLYVSPERLSVPEFRASLGRFGLALVAVDEAHCISEWGHEFRPDYRALHLVRRDYPDVPIAAFTATATLQVQADVARLLGLRDPLLVRASFDRPEIFYRVAPRDGSGDGQILDFVRAHPDQPGIVYRGTRKAVEATAEYLDSRGVSAVAYHAGLDDESRHRGQEAFVKDEVTIVVATIAFGMGIDKSNVRWVVHGDLPRSLESYYQETGRAARDGDPADTLLLHAPGDAAAIRWHIGKLETEGERERAEARLARMLGYAATAECRRRLLLAHFDEAHPGGCGRCDVCAGEVAYEDATVDAQKVLSAAVRTGERFGAHHLADVVVGRATDAVMERGHDSLPTFGVGRDRDRDWWLDLIRDMTSSDLLLRGEGRMAGLRLSQRGRMVLRGREQFRVVRAAGSGGPAPEERPALDHPAEQALLAALKALRKRLASARGLPPYIIFSDRALREMARSRPRDAAGFLACHGVGQRKLAEYGRLFMDAIREFEESLQG